MKASEVLEKTLQNSAFSPSGFRSKTKRTSNSFICRSPWIRNTIRLRRIVFRIHGDRQINELLVRLVFDRKPDGLNAEFCKVFSKTSLAFMRPKRTRPYPYAGRRLLLRPGDKVRVGARVRRKPKRPERDRCPRQDAEQKCNDHRLTQSGSIHGHL